MATDFPRLVVDANIMVSALLGRSFPLLIALFESGVRLFAPVHQLAETRHVLRSRPAIPPEWVDEQMERLLALVEPLHPALLDPFEEKARSRLGEGGDPDWPVLAGTYATKAAAWSHDKDLFGSGAPVWATRVLRREIESSAA